MTPTALTDAFRSGLIKLFNYVPQLIGAIVILIIGYIIAKILQAGVRRLLRRWRFDHALHTSPAGRYIIRVVESPSAVAAGITFWVIFLIFVSFAASALNLQVLNTILNSIYAYIPRVIAAIIIFLIASAVSAGSAAFVQRILGRTPEARIIAAIIPAITLSIATFMILDELAIAPTIVTITYTAIMGALALGLALAFGLGGRDLARNILDQAYNATQRNADSIKSGANRARTNARRAAEEARENLD
jgi:uncharacterized protein YacL